MQTINSAFLSELKQHLYDFRQTHVSVTLKDFLTKRNLEKWSWWFELEVKEEGRK